MYLEIVKYVIPIGLVVLISDVSQMVGNAAISRLSNSDSDVIGAFVSVYFFATLLCSITKSFKMVVLSIPENTQQMCRIFYGNVLHLRWLLLLPLKLVTRTMVD